MIVPRWFLWIITTVLLVWLLAVGRSLLVPVAVALVLFSLMVGLTSQIARLGFAGWSVPRPLATAIGLIIVAYALFLFASVLSSQVEAVISASPGYMSRVRDLLSEGAELLGRDIAADLRDAFSQINLAAQLTGLAGSAGSMVTAITLIVLYMAFMFAERGVFNAKFARLFPDAERADEVRSILGAIYESVQRYFAVKLFVSALTGLAAYAVMKPMGLDFAETWALLTALLNFIPNIGSAVATILPAIVALVQFETLGPFLIIAVGVSAIQLTIGNFVEPALMGRSLNLSPLVIILSLTFWALVWGIVGMFLAVPIMVIVLIVCSHVPAWRWIAVVLSRDGQIPEGGKLTSAR
jgi:AI-2 transport protein TqsA